MSAIFQRPLCEMGKAYDFAFRPHLGEPATGDGGPCDDRPSSIELFGAFSDPASPGAGSRMFLLCPEHRTQLARYDRALSANGVPSRFRSPPPGPTP